MLKSYRVCDLLPWLVCLCDGKCNVENEAEVQSTRNKISTSRYARLVPWSRLSAAVPGVRGIQNEGHVSEKKLLECMNHDECMFEVTDRHGMYQVVPAAVAHRWSVM